MTDKIECGVISVPRGKGEAVGDALVADALATQAVYDATLPRAGWSEVTEHEKFGERITYTEHGTSVFDSPPHLPGWICYHVSRSYTNTTLTVWFYRPIGV